MKRRTTKERADSFMDMIAQSVANGQIKIVKAEAVAPCLHPIQDSECVGTPDAQNLHRCKICSKEWLR